MRAIRAFLAENGGESIRIVAKIENAHAVDHIEEIIEVSDAVMVARGDLGVEVPSNQVPHLQKKIIKACNRAYRPVITATQMLDSMIRNPRPTRAEVADVANAIYDGTDAVTLSGETAIGMYPVPAVQTMARIAEASESHIYDEGSIPNRNAEQKSISAVVGLAAVTAAENPYDDRSHGPHRFQLPSEDAHLCGNHFGRIPSLLAAELGRYAAFGQSRW